MEDISINDWLTILSALGEYHDKHAALAKSMADYDQQEADAAVRLRKLIRDNFLR